MFGPFAVFQPRRLPTEPGSGNMALMPTHGLPRGSIGGAGREYTFGAVSTIGAFPVWQEAPLWYGHDQVIVGLEGVPYWGINPEAPSDFDGGS